jgi:hypothetical protein
LKELDEGKNELPVTEGDTQILRRRKEPREALGMEKNVRIELEKMGVEKGYFSCRKVANKSRKIANKVLGRYGIDLDSENVLAFGTKLEVAGLIEKLRVDEVDFFRLKHSVPPIKRNEQTGQLELYKISSSPEWLEIAAKCNIETEDVSYQADKKAKRDLVFERNMFFARGLDKMRQDGLGIYLHPAYYNEQGELDPGRFNAFYVLWGFEKYRNHTGGPSQARLLAEKCVELGRPIIACVPGESFLPAELRETETSYIRAVALPRIETLKAALHTISLVAREIKNG